MTDEEFRADLLAASAARAEAHETSLRDGFAAEVLERLRDAGEVPDAESCAETLTGQSRRRLEVDAFAFDDADKSLHLFVTMRDGGPEAPSSDHADGGARSGFQSAAGSLRAGTRRLARGKHRGEPAPVGSRPAHPGRGQTRRASSARGNRPSNERAPTRDQGGPDEGRCPGHFPDLGRDQVEAYPRGAERARRSFCRPVRTARRRPHRATGCRRIGDYDAYLAVVPGEALADIYIEHGSRLLEGNVRTYLGRRGNINRGIAATLSSEPARFFAYNNGIAATASEVRTVAGPGGTIVLTGVADLQIVNGAQTTASLASLRRDGKLPKGAVSVPMKLSVVAPAVAEELIPRISRFANTQNTVRASDFFANHAFHRRMEEISRRILAPAVSGSLTQTHWYYERARGQHLNDQAGLTQAKKDQFLRQNPRGQVITKTDLAKVESCFDLLPDIACKGAEKAFVAFAERVTEEWRDERRRSAYGDDWYRAAVSRTILFRAAEGLVSKAPWYEGGYRAQVVAYSMARLAALAEEQSRGGRLDYLKVWSAQAAGNVLERQLLAIAEVMMGVLRSPPLAGQNISEWAKQQACRKKALETAVPIEAGFDLFLLGKQDARSATRDDREGQRVAEGMRAITEVVAAGAAFWSTLRMFAQAKRLTMPDDEGALTVASSIPRRLPTDGQAARLLALRRRCEEAGFSTPK